MDKTLLKKFAISSREDLSVKIKNKIDNYYIDEEFSKEQNGDTIVLQNSKHYLSFSVDDYNKRELLIKRIKELSIDQVIEEAAYTWFNRIIAIRYMEINDILPLTKDNKSMGIRVLSSNDNTNNPEILKFSNLINSELDIGFNKDEYSVLKDDNQKIKYILLLLCKKFSKLIPQVFDGITDYIDILIPDNLLNDTGFITKIINEVPEENFKNVEIIGWLYQYYNQTEKDKVISKKVAYKKNEIPYATQLFTPSWIVKYLVENSIGNYCIENKICDEKVIDEFQYFLKENSITTNSKLNIEDLIVIDPCCGSGHILTYIFEVLYKIYLSLGYNKRDIPKLILKKNLYGIDIDDRAGQLSILSIVLKAREYDKEIFNENIGELINIISIQESNNINETIMTNLKKDVSIEDAKYLIRIFKDAKEIGSLINVEKHDYSILKQELENNDTIFGIELRKSLTPLIKQAEILSKKFDIVITNPPYMGQSYMPFMLKKYINENYSNSKSDLCTAFMEVPIVKQSGLLAMINQHSWMFLSSFEDLRKDIIENKYIINMIHLGSRAFEEIGGEVVQTTAFVIKNEKSNRESTFVRLVDFDKAELKEEKFLESIKENSNIFRKNIKEFNNVPGYSIAYWVSENIINSFSNKLIGDLFEVKQGMTTGNNNLFLRHWYEVDFGKIGFNLTNDQAKVSTKKWFPYNKGGEFRKWYGNNDYIVNYENDGEEMKLYTSKLPQGTWVRLKSREYYFRESITWSFIASSTFGARYSPNGFIFDVAGSSLFADEKDIFYVLGVLTSKIAFNVLQMLNPTLNYQTKDIKSIPFIKSNTELVDGIVKENIEISKEDWNSFETSWNFEEHPLIKYRDCSNNKNSFSIKEIFNKWQDICNKNFSNMKSNEEKLNEIFIDIYKLGNEIEPSVEDKDISIRKADIEREIKSLISYAVGCMFGRYSLDKKGLICAGGIFNKDNYTSFEADKDNIIPLTEENYFGDDIVSRFTKFIEIVYGKDTLYENLDFIAETLGKKNGENSEETIRRYFINDFYNDHIRMYQKRPIYWIFDSGKKNGFKCLIYMHRYNESLASKIRLDYLHRMQNAYEKELKEISDKLNNDVDLTSKRELSKKQADISAKLQETNEYDEKIAHIADQKIKIDLDDGVVVNYAKFSVKNPKTGKDESILAKRK